MCVLLTDSVFRYKLKHGFIFLTSARGRSPEDILAEAEQRIQNDTATELRRAKVEEGRILVGRLDHLLGDLPSKQIPSSI